MAAEILNQVSAVERSELRDQYLKMKKRAGKFVLCHYHCAWRQAARKHEIGEGKLQVVAHAAVKLAYSMRQIFQAEFQEKGFRFRGNGDGIARLRKSGPA